MNEQTQTENIVNKLEIVIKSLVSIGTFDINQAGIYNCVIDYIDLVENYPDIKEWLDSEYIIWVKNGKNKKYPSPWYHYEDLYDIFKYYRDQNIDTTKKILPFWHAYNELLSFHRLVLNKLTKNGVVKKKYKLNFNSSTGVLKIDEYVIPFRNRDEITNSIRILTYLFDELPIGETVLYYDLADYMGGDYKNPAMVCYRACDNINKTISTTTDGKIIKFLDFKAGQNSGVRINSEYIHN